MRAWVNVASDFSMGVCTHIDWPVASPTPTAPIASFEMVAFQLHPPGLATGTVKLTTTVKHRGYRIMLDGHDCGPLIQDITPMDVPNLMYVLMWPFSARRCQFAASTVLMEGLPTGVADITTGAPMMTCGLPMSLPSAIVVSNFSNTVKVGVTGGDLLGGWGGALLSATIDCMFFALSGGLSSIPKKLFDGLLRKLAGVPNANALYKAGAAALAGLVVSGVRCIATGGEYPVKLEGKVTVGNPLEGGTVKVSVSWDKKAGLKAGLTGEVRKPGVQGTATGSVDSKGGAKAKTGGSTFGKPLSPPDDRPGWVWDPARGWSRPEGA